MPETLTKSGGFSYETRIKGRDDARVTQDLQTIIIKGKIFSDLGEGVDFTRLPWVRKEFIQRVGVDPYPDDPQYQA
ncbi:MAG: hypothetical protein RQM92_12360 [Candidatus Syntrophopropionicum ammoniitolerans]